MCTTYCRSTNEDTIQTNTQTTLQTISMAANTPVVFAGWQVRNSVGSEYSIRFLYTVSFVWIMILVNNRTILPRCLWYCTLKIDFSASLRDDRFSVHRHYGVYMPTTTCSVWKIINAKTTDYLRESHFINTIIWVETWVFLKIHLCAGIRRRPHIRHQLTEHPGTPLRNNGAQPTAIRSRHTSKIWIKPQRSAVTAIRCYLPSVVWNAIPTLISNKFITSSFITDSPRSPRTRLLRPLQPDRVSAFSFSSHPPHLLTEPRCGAAGVLAAAPVGFIGDPLYGVLAKHLLLNVQLRTGIVRLRLGWGHFSHDSSAKSKTARSARTAAPAHGQHSAAAPALQFPPRPALDEHLRCKLRCKVANPKTCRQTILRPEPCASPTATTPPHRAPTVSQLSDPSQLPPTRPTLVLPVTPTPIPISILSTTTSARMA